MNMKKNILAAILALASSGVFATTLNPVQLLNPTGSSSGQTIVSTGASTAPGWANLSVGNVTGAAPLASPAFTGAVSVTNPAASGTTLTVTNTTAANGAVFQMVGNGATTPGKFLRVSSGLFQITNSANSAVIFQLDDSGNLSSIANLALSGSVTPSQTAGIIGTTTNNNASTGSVGEFPNNSASGVSLTNATAANVTSTSLTAGDWDVQCGVQFIPAGGTTFTQGIVSVSTTSATQASLVSGGGQSIWSGSVVGQQEAVQSGIARLSLASSGTAYCVGTAGFSASTLTANGYIRARRVR